MMEKVILMRGQPIEIFEKLSQAEPNQCSLYMLEKSFGFWVRFELLHIQT